MLLAHAQLTAARDNEGAIIKGQCIREGNKKTLPTPPSEKKDVDFGFFFCFKKNKKKMQSTYSIESAAALQLLQQLHCWSPRCRMFLKGRYGD